MTANDPFNVLLVEDDEIMRLSLCDRLSLDDVPVIGATCLAEAEHHLRLKPIDLVVTDIRLPDGSGRALFDHVSRHTPGIPVLLMTAFGSVPEAVALTKAGALDYLTKPFDLADFVARIKRERIRLSDARKAARLAAPDGTRFRPGSGYLGLAPCMRRLETMIERMRNLTSSVLITGESGVGKEVVANLIHTNSPRKNGPLIKVNCAAIPFELAESELFGHEKGAFSGAERRHIGKFEQADGGTIFLDEIAEAPPQFQVKLLRVLQEHTVQRVGGEVEIPVALRVIAATQKPLDAALRNGSFRPDLYWRLNVIQIPIPPLRARQEDILLLANRFVIEASAAIGCSPPRLSTAAEDWLMAMTFPGNVRELKNLVERAVAFCTDGRIEPVDLCAPSEIGGHGDGLLRDAVAMAERDAICRALARRDGAVAQAAQSLGISRKNLWEKMKRYGIAHTTAADPAGPNGGV